MSDEQPTIGRIVHYRLTADEAELVNRRIEFWTPRGNRASQGDVVPLLVVKVWPNEPGRVNGQAFTDGDDSLWVMGAKEGTEPGTWSWPARVQRDMRQRAFGETEDEKGGA